LAFDILDSGGTDLYDSAAIREEGIEKEENRLIHDVRLEHEQNLVAVCRERPIRDEDFVENVEVTEITQRGRRFDRGLEICAESVEGCGTVDRDLGFAWLTG